MNQKFKIISVVGICIIFILLSFGLFKKTNVMYCQYENSYYSYEINKTECVLMKVISKDITMEYLSNLTNMKGEHITCSYDVLSLPVCYGDVYDFDEQPLTVFCKDQCDVHGKLCLASWSTYNITEGYSYLYNNLINSTRTSYGIFDMLMECDI